MVVIKTYSELYDYFQAYSFGSISFLIIQSRGGVGKSYHAQHLINDDSTHTFTGHVTPYSLFKITSQHADKRLIFDDVDTLLQNKTNVALLKQITDTTEPRIVKWQTTRGGENASESFNSNNQTLVLANQTKWNTADLQALKTRAIYVEFTPTNQEVMSQLSQFFSDKEILSFIRNKLDAKPFTLNFRMPLKGKELKNAGIDWKNYLNQAIDEQKPDKAELAKKLQDKHDTAKAAADEFCEITGLSSRKSYYNYLNK
jgi:hypothetical protein